MSKKYQKTSRTDTVRIHRRLSEVLLKGEDGLVAYADGVNDKTIAEELNVNPSAVMGIRAECFGLVKARGVPKPKPEGVEKMEKTISALQQLVQNLLTSYADLKDRHNRLCLQLSAQQVTNCKHLMLVQGSGTAATPPSASPQGPSAIRVGSTLP